MEEFDMKRTRWSVVVLAFGVFALCATAWAQEEGRDADDGERGVRERELDPEKAESLRKKAAELRELGEEAMAKALERKANALGGKRADRPREGKRPRDGQPRRDWGEGAGRMMKAIEDMEKRAEALKAEGNDEEAETLLKQAKMRRERVETLKKGVERRRQGAERAATVRKEFDAMKAEVERLSKELAAIKALLKELAGEPNAEE